MKKIILLFTLFLSFVACSSDDDKNSSDQNQQELPLTVENLTGTWLAVETRESSGTPDLGPFHPISESDRYTLKFEANLNYVNGSNSDCDGVYEVASVEKEIHLTYEQTCFRNNNVLHIRFLSISQLIISKSGGDEGFQIKYEKAN